MVLLFKPFLSFCISFIIHCVCVIAYGIILYQISSLNRYKVFLFKFGSFCEFICILWDNNYSSVLLILPFTGKSCFYPVYAIVHSFSSNDKHQTFCKLLLYWKFSDVFLMIRVGLWATQGGTTEEKWLTHHIMSRVCPVNRDSPWLALSLIAQRKCVSQPLHCEVPIPSPSMLYSVESCNHKECTTDG